MESIDRFKLRKPLVVMTIGACFIAAVPLNLGHALYSAQVENWYSPFAWLILYSKLPFAQQLLFFFMPVAGGCLFYQKKTSWFIAGLLAGLMAIENVYFFFADKDLLYPLWIPILVNMSLLVIFFHFRYPFLDQRDRLFKGISIRFDISLPVQVTGYPSGFLMTNISDSGCFLSPEHAQILPSLGDTLRLKLGEWMIKGHVVRLNAVGCGVRFTEPLYLSKSMIRTVLEGDAKRRAVAA